MFKLPHLGLPDPTGELVLVKAAIGTKAAALDRLVNDPTFKTPLRLEEDDCGMTGFDFQGALWALPLLKPAASPNAPPEFFSVKVRRMFPDAYDFPRTKLPDHFDWVFYPMSVYKGLQNQSSAKDEQEELGGFLFQGGRASEARDAAKQTKKKKQRNPNEEISELEALSMDIFEESWWEGVQLQAMLEEFKLGNRSPKSPADLTIRVRVHPTPNDDYRGLDYAICRADDPSDAKPPEERWKPMPPEATKPGGERYHVNLCRKSKGHKPFTKEEWDQMPHPPQY